MNGFNQSIVSKDWVLVYLSTHCAHPKKTCTLTLVSAKISTDNWEQMDFPLGDVTIVVVKGVWGRITILNIYNDGNNNETINQLKQFHRTKLDTGNQSKERTAHAMWVGDFNHHHPHWDNPSNTRLFTEEALKAAEVLIEAVVSLGMDLILPSGIPTHCHYVMKKWSWLDQVFLSDHSLDLVEVCNTETCFRSIKMDHLPVVTQLNLSIPAAQTTNFRNFRDVDWEEFRNSLKIQLARLEQPGPIMNQEQLDRNCKELTAAIQAAIEDKVPKTELCSKSKRWWTKELTQMWRK